MLRFSFRRIFGHTKLRILLCFLLFFPSCELLFYIYQILVYGSYVDIPDYAFFLTCNSGGIGHVFQSIFLWFMPLYCLVLTADDCIEDQEIYYKNILISKIGKRNYIKKHLEKSFLNVFFVIAGGLLLNLVLSHILFRGGIFNPYGEDFSTSLFYLWEIKHPFLTNILFIVITSFVCSLIGMVGTITSLMLKQKKVIYGITMLFWVVPFLQEKSLMLLFQPHSEYVLDTLIPIALKTCIPYIIYIIFGYFKEVYFAKKAC